MPKVNLQLAEGAEPQIVDAQLNGDAFTVKLNEDTYKGTLNVTGPGEGWLNLDGRILQFFMAQKSDQLSIWIEGRTYNMQLVSPDARRGGGAAVPTGDIKAPMPGTVLKILVKTGDKVEANQPLVIMESMKMEMTLAAPTAATVTAVDASEGKLVDMGAVLVKLDPDAG